MCPSRWNCSVTILECYCATSYVYNGGNNCLCSQSANSSGGFAKRPALSLHLPRVPFRKPLPASRGPLRCPARCLVLSPVLLLALGRAVGRHLAAGANGRFQKRVADTAEVQTPASKITSRAIKPPCVLLLGESASTIATISIKEQRPKQRAPVRKPKA